MGHTIVIPLAGPYLDKDGISERALPVARALAQQLEAPILFISVIDFMAELGGLPESELEKPETLQRYAQEREMYLQDIADSFTGVRTMTAVRFGEPGPQIVSAMDSLDHPIVVMASHNRKGIHRLVLGSVAFSCVQNADCPVIVVPGGEDVDPNSTARLQNILIPLDGSALAESVLEAALEVVGSTDTRFHLLKIIEPIARQFSSTEEDYERVTHDLSVKYLEELTARLLLDDHNVSWEVRFGQPEVEIAAVTDEYDFDMIAMATQGRTGFGRLIFGSTVESVSRSTRLPLFVVKADESAIRKYVRSIRAGRSTRSRDVAGEIAGKRVRDVMTTPPITATQHASLEQIAHMMIENRIGSIPIVDDQGKLCGIITESDFTGDETGVPFSSYRVPKLFGQWISREGIEKIHAAGRELKASQIMSAPVVTATEDEPITAVVERFITNDINRIPVVKDDVPVGIVARHDLLSMVTRNAESDQNQPVART
ncbi:MAG: universal stress protein [Chloroflexota bacterium]